MANANFLRSHFDEAHSHPFGFITNNYKDFGNDFSTPLMYILFCSSLDKSVWFSMEKPTNNLLIPSNNMLLLPISINMGSIGTCTLLIRRKIYIKGGPDGLPTSGRLTISTMSMD